MNNLNFDEMGLALAIRLTEKNKVPKTQKGLARVIKNHCTFKSGIFLKEYFNNVKSYDQSVAFRSKLLEVTWNILSK